MRQFWYSLPGLLEGYSSCCKADTSAIWSMWGSTEGVQALRYVALFTLPTTLYLIALTVFNFREIQHPNILSILGVDVGKDHVSIITNFVRGTSLHSRIFDATHPRVHMWISPL